jgi:hypothetical protein
MLDPDTLLQHIEQAQHVGAVQILSWMCYGEPILGRTMFKVVFKTNKKMSTRTADMLQIHISLNYPNHTIHNMQIEDFSKVIISYSMIEAV